MLSDNDLRTVQNELINVSEPVKMSISGTDSPTSFEANLLTTSRQIAGVAPNAILFDDRGTSLFPGRPCITLSGAAGTNLHYLAAPEGPELAPFLEAIKWLENPEKLPADVHFRSLDRLTGKVNILVFIAAACPHCPAVVRNSLMIGISQPLVEITVLDALACEDIADRFKVKSTPTVIIDEAATFVGTLPLDRMIDAVLDAAGSGSLTPILESMIGAGRAEEAALLLRRKGDPRAILPIYSSPEFSARMGALLVIDEILEEEPRFFDPIAGELIPLLSHENAGLRGDTAELLGRIKAIQALEALRKLCRDPDPDVREAAGEAIDLLVHDP